jgi:DNA-binding CsgD family transcriptional regulator
VDPAEAGERVEVEAVHEAVAGHRAPAQHPPRVRGLAGALALGPPTGADPFAVGAATLGLIADAAGTSPILLVTDDLQWIDTASLDAIVFAARRLEAEPVAVLLAGRDGTPVTVPGRLGLPVRHVTGLDRAASVALVAGSSADTIPDEVVDRLFIETGGNPLALVAIARLVPQGLVAALESLGDEPLPVDERIERAFAADTAALPDGARAAILLAAANDAADVGPVLAALASMGGSRADLEAAEARGLLAIDGPRLEFRHPLVRSTVYHAADPGHRRAAHRALADVLTGDDGVTTTRRAWHLAESVVGHDERVAAALEASARLAAGRGGFVAAAQAWERAARLSPDAAAGAQRLYGAADAWFTANHHPRALALLDEADASAREPLLRADIALLRGRIDAYRGPGLETVGHLHAVAEAIRDVAPRRAVRLLTTAAMCGIVAGDLGAALMSAERAHVLAPARPDDAELIASLQLGKVRVLTGDVRGGLPLVMRAAEMLDLAHEIVGDADMITVAPALLTIEAYDLEDALLTAAIRAGRAGNALGMLAYCLGSLAELDTRRGRWTAAEASGTEAVQLAREAAQAGQLSYNLARVGRIDAARGRDDACRSRVTSALEIARRIGYGSTLPFAESTLGLLHLGRGRFAEAILSFEAAGRAFLGEGFRTPGRLEWQADLAEARLRSGDDRGAEEELDRLDATIAACAGTGPEPRLEGCLLATATATRCRGLLAAPAEADSWFPAALAWHARTPVPFELARTELAYGEQLRRAGRKADARPHLRAALDTFDRLAAEPWSDRARVELVATGERLDTRRERPLEQLTSQELQVAMLIAGGATNREAGAALFLTTKTIEFHLAKIYRKLELRSRTELAAWAARQLPAGVH